MTLRIGFISTIRPLFKGDAPAAALRSRDGLVSMGRQLDFEVVTPKVAASRAVRHTETGAQLPEFAIHDQASAEQAAAELGDLDLDLLLVQHTTFATGELLSPLLRLPLPVGLWALPEAAGGRGLQGPLPLNSLCGLNMTLSFLDKEPTRRKQPVKWFYGEADSEWFQARLRPTLMALRSLRAVRSARILQIGGTAPNFYGLEEVPDLPGVHLERLPLATLFERVERVPTREAASLASRWRSEERTSLTSEQLERSAALELGLRDIVARGDFDAVALRCWPELPDRCGTMACATLARLGDGDVATACEGDVMGALSMLALQAASCEPALLMDLSDIDDQRGVFFWHCGNGALSWAGASGTVLSTHFNRDGLGTVRDMSIRPGAATGFRLLDKGRRALVFGGSFGQESLNGAETGDQGADSGFDGVRGWLSDLSWDGVPTEPRQFIATVLDRRVPHHFALGRGELTEGLQEMCSWLGAETVAPSVERDTL